MTRNWFFSWSLLYVVAQKGPLTYITDQWKSLEDAEKTLRLSKPNHARILRETTDLDKIKFLIDGIITSPEEKSQLVERIFGELFPWHLKVLGLGSEGFQKVINSSEYFDFE